MTQEQYDKSIKTGELQLGLWQKAQHFSIVVFCFFIPAVLLLIHAFEYLKGNPAYFAAGELYILIIPIVLGVLFYWMQKNRLKFKIVKTVLTKDEIKNLIEMLCKEYKWTSSFHNTHVFILKTNPGFFSGSWGEQITILLNGDDVLLNSICDPDQKSSVVSMSRNRENIETLVVNIEKNNTLKTSGNTEASTIN